MLLHKQVIDIGFFENYKQTLLKQDIPLEERKNRYRITSMVYMISLSFNVAGIVLCLILVYLRDILILYVAALVLAANFPVMLWIVLKFNRIMREILEELEGRADVP
jgi:hypothetical protein